MQIDSFCIEGFKSLYNVQVKNLSDINVFYGLNDTGKSNIFQALSLWYQICIADTSQQEVQIRQNEIIQKQLSNFTPPIQSLNTNQAPFLGVRLQSNKASSEAEIFLDSGKITYRGQGDVFPPFHLIQADRRFQPEQQGQQNDEDSITHQNLKQSLFYAYLSRDMHQKQRLKAIKTTLADPPFELGELDIALDPATNQIDIGFIRPMGRIPIENVGSGVQQLLLVLGQIFLNDYPIVAIEEPEMNLSPQYQQYLLVALKKIMADPAVSLRQLFISTHSPYFEFAENFYDVTKDEQGMTQVAQRPLNQRARYFPNTQVSDPSSGARLNLFNQITLDDDLLTDMKLQRGDMVYTIKNETGRWELHPEQEILADLQTVFDEGSNGSIDKRQVTPNA
ncbi:AAA family ATPase [Anaerolineales bacterium HSG25]|nr:AAA family ATPase [Anaerolineales bacterium HSG25]